jgi:AcrR family transcriptional regulator
LYHIFIFNDASRVTCFSRYSVSKVWERKVHNDEETTAEEAYHQRVKEEKRSAAVQAAMELFLEKGYARTSPLQVARRADLSSAILFKGFPTKAALFEAIVEEFWAAESDCIDNMPFGESC